MRKRRFTKVGFNTKLIIDVVAASLIVQQAPRLIQSIFPMDDTIGTVAGVGAGYLVGSMLKRPDLANASIALGAVQFVAPMVDDLLSGGTGAITQSPLGIAYKSQTYEGVTKKINPITSGVSDYLRLNDYISLGASQVNATYRDSY